VRRGEHLKMSRRHFEVCVFSYLAAELKSGDICVKGSREYADYREQLLSWENCESLVDEYCQNLGFPSQPDEFVKHLKSWLEETAITVDKGYPNNTQVIINEDGEPVLKRLAKKSESVSVKAKLMPRIRNWKDLTFYRPEATTTYQHIDSLFKESIDWELIRTHWSDLFQVVLSIYHGKISSSVLLRKLGNYSRKNRLYKAFQEVGRVVRTVFLLQYISDAELRQQINAATNKVESYNGFSKWFCFGGEGIIADNDPEEQEKTIKYNTLIANAVIFHNAVDLTEILQKLKREGYLIDNEDIKALSPYLTEHIKRFGDYLLDMQTLPKRLDEVLA
jgi:hypothetical protein